MEITIYRVLLSECVVKDTDLQSINESVYVNINDQRLNLTEQTSPRIMGRSPEYVLDACPSSSFHTCSPLSCKLWSLKRCFKDSLGHRSFWRGCSFREWSSSSQRKLSDAVGRRWIRQLAAAFVRFLRSLTNIVQSNLTSEIWVVILIFLSVLGLVRYQTYQWYYFSECCCWSSVHRISKYVR